jgi:hypothetical protein
MLARLFLAAVALTAALGTPNSQERRILGTAGNVAERVGE